MSPIVVVEYDPGWIETFERLRSQIWPVVSDIATAVEHVGSTSVPGLAAKPIVDITVVVPTLADVPAATTRLGTLGYVHCGNLGVEGREAFKARDGMPRHHLYLCPRDSLALANHLAVRKHLREHPDAAREYGELKKRLAVRYADSIDDYTQGKTETILRILRMAGFRSEDLDAIERVNRKAG